MLLYTNIELLEKEIKEKTPLTIASQRIKYLPINLIKEMKDLHTNNNKYIDKRN